MNAITSASSNSTTRVLILWRVILPASAHRKIVLGQTPSRLATDLALLNFRTVTPPKGLSDSAGDFEFVDIVGFMRSFRSVCNCAPPRIRGRRTTVKTVASSAMPHHSGPFTARSCAAGPIGRETSTRFLFST